MPSLSEAFLRDSVPSSGDVIEPLIIDAGEIEISAYEFSGGPLHITPLVRCGDVIVVPEPGALLPAARHRILSSAYEQGFLEQVSTAYHEAVFSNILRHLEYWRFPIAPVDLPEMATDSSLGTCFSEGVFVLDADKALYVQLLTDPLKDFSPDSAFGYWRSESLSDDLEARQLRIVELLKAEESSPDRILILTIVAGIGRFFVLGFKGELLPDSLRLLMIASEFVCGTMLDAGDQLALWKFARSSETARRKVNIIAVSFLDEYQLYRSQEHSFYVSDQRLPTRIFIVPGMGWDLIKEAHERFDSHGISSFNAKCDARGFEDTVLVDLPDLWANSARYFDVPVS